MSQELLFYIYPTSGHSNISDDFNPVIPTPSQVMVIHSHVVAHQTFAMRLIGWLDSILAYSEGFRALFSTILVEQEVTVFWKQT